MYQKLDENVVREILAALAERRPSQKEIAATFGVSPQQVSAILRGLTWKHLPRSTGLPRYKH